MAAPVRAPEIDIMNDPEYAPVHSSSSDPDHCRICRSESSSEEPLFHPCKCSGSIKFVHQDCLMEWLQHSQKKYCELCKTPFRFTKLYDPAMPKTLPLPLFLTRASHRLGHTLLLWLRALLVCFVWLGILPWSVRWMWRFWFWLGDGAWWKNSFSQQNLLVENRTDSGPTNLTSANETTIGSGLDNGSQEQWASGITFANLTRNGLLNKVILDTFEGQILTALIIVTFVMIFLIREWVVQQQPNLAMAEDGAGLDNLQDVDAVHNPAAIELDEEEEEDEEDGEFGHTDEMLDSAYGRLDATNNEDDIDIPYPQPYQTDDAAGRPRVYAPLRRRRAFPPVEGNEDQASTTGFNGPGYTLGDDSLTGSASASTQTEGIQRRRPLANREVMAQAAELRRQIEERFAASSTGSSTDSNLADLKPSPLRNEVVDDNSDWEDEDEDEDEDEGGEEEGDRRQDANGEPDHENESNLETPPAGPSRGASTAFGVSPSGLFEMENTVQPNLHWLGKDKGTDSPFSQTFESARTFHEPPPVVFGKSQPGNFFGHWDTSQKPIFGHPFDVDQPGKITDSVSATAETPGGPFPENEAPKSSPKLSARDKGKGREVQEEEMEEIDWTFALEREDLCDTDSQEAEPYDRFHTEDDYMKAENERPMLETPTEDVLAEEPQLPVNELHALLAVAVEAQVQPQEDANIAIPPQIPARPPRRPARANRFFDWIVGDIPEIDLQEGGAAGHVILPLPGGAIDRHGFEDVDRLDADDNAVLFQNIGQQQQDQRIDAEALQGENLGGGAAAAVDIDDADDFDGIMELLGMRGPLYGLVQNASICIVLITAAVMLGVAVPYIWGRILLTVLAHPFLFAVVIPWSAAVFCANLVIDSATYIACTVLYEIDHLLRFILRLCGLLLPTLASLGNNTKFSNILYGHAHGGWNRVVNKIMSMAFQLDRTRNLKQLPVTNLQVHTTNAWLASRQPWAKATLAMSWFTEKLAASVNLTTNASQNLQEFSKQNKTTSEVLHAAAEKLVDIWSQPSIKQLNTTFADPITSEYEAAFVELTSSSSWSAADRVIAVIAGYTLFTLIGAWYLSKYKSRPGSYRRHLEKATIELLQQAGGVMKVILIIGIEMFVFPLYCGLLLDVALLPLFENATILSRIQFTVDHIFTSTFVHWFVGTCYMFHFALFVSMCRKIMRSGVLYFIRDPDDPTLHPVKDVLERPVMLQLRKIAFSAFIYGFLVLVCLGGVVWWLYHAFNGVLPIHWSSNEPVLEFPVDLLFYNFFMPVAVQFFKPSEGLQHMYGWWFRQCARALRLTSFMFGDRRPDEEGRVIRNSWTARLLFKGADATVAPEVKSKTEIDQQETYFLKDGRFVRAPASDSVRRPKGEAVFIPVDENNRRLDDKPDPEDGETGPNSTDFKLVYIPPNFKTRVGLVVISIWIFAAVTGVGVTIGPLILGRSLLRMVLPKDRRMNDVYAFSIGIYLIGGIVYMSTKTAAVKEWFKSASVPWRSPARAGQALTLYALPAIKLLYMLIAFVIVLPTLFAMMIEFYLIIPTHTYFFSGETHVIHFIQDWTLGVLYIKMLGNMLLLDAESPWARALRGIVARGYFDPDVRLATRCFILPATVMMVAALLLPLGLGYLFNKAFMQDADPATVSQMYRYSYPAVFVLFVLLAIGYFLKMVVDRWEQSVRDEVYLIGERLHNHGERRLPQAVSSPTTTATTETSNTGPEPLALLEIGQAVENQLQHMDRSVQSHRAAEGTQA